MNLIGWETFEYQKNTLYKKVDDFLISVSVLLSEDKNIEVEAAIVHNLSNNIITEKSFENLSDAFNFIEDFLKDY